MRILLVMAYVAALGAATLAAGPTSAATFQVSTVDFSFVPTPLTIETGDMVDFEIGFTHNVVETVAEGSCTTKPDGFLSGVSETDTSVRSFSISFEVAGTYYYKCTPHCLAGMTGTIVVEEKVGAEAPSWSRVKALYESD